MRDAPAFAGIAQHDGFEAVLAHELLGTLQQQQAASLAYFDVFWLSAILAAGLMLSVLLMKRSVAEKGGPAATE